MDWLREMLGNHYGQFNTKQEIVEMTNNMFLDPGMLGATVFGHNCETQLIHNQQMLYQRGQTSEGLLARQFIGQSSQDWLDAMLDVELGL